MLQSASSATTRTPTPPASAADRGHPAPVVDLADRRASRSAAEPEILHITPELIAALEGTWQSRSR